MTPSEAIEKEIEKEKKELEDLDAEEKRLRKELLDNPNGPKHREALWELLEVVRKLIRRAESEQEIEGKRKALAAAQASPNDPLGGIDAEIDAEMKKADEIGRKAQELREKAWQDEQAKKKDDAQKAREEAKRLSDEFDLELARLRGKREARRAVERVLPKPKPKIKTGRGGPAYA